MVDDFEENIQPSEALSKKQQISVEMECWKCCYLLKKWAFPAELWGLKTETLPGVRKWTRFLRLCYFPLRTCLFFYDNKRLLPVAVFAVSHVTKYESGRGRIRMCNFYYESGTLAYEGVHLTILKIASKVTWPQFRSPIGPHALSYSHSHNLDGQI